MDKTSEKTQKMVKFDEYYKEYLKEHPIPYDIIFTLSFVNALLYFIFTHIVSQKIWYGIKFKKLFLCLFSLIITLTIYIGYNYLSTWLHS